MIMVNTPRADFFWSRSCDRHCCTSDEMASRRVGCETSNRAPWGRLEAGARKNKTLVAGFALSLDPATISISAVMAIWDFRSD